MQERKHSDPACIFQIDIIYNFNTGVMGPGEYIDDRLLVRMPHACTLACNNMLTHQFGCSAEALRCHVFFVL